MKKGEWLNELKKHQHMFSSMHAPFANRMQWENLKLTRYSSNRDEDVVRFWETWKIWYLFPWILEHTSFWGFFMNLNKNLHFLQLLVVCFLQENLKNPGVELKAAAVVTENRESSCGRRKLTIAIRNVKGKLFHFQHLFTLKVDHKISIWNNKK